MIANRRGACQTWAAHGNVALFYPFFLPADIFLGLDAYCYRFNTIPNGLPWFVGGMSNTDEKYGNALLTEKSVTHFQEVAFVFDNVDGLGYNAEHGT